MTKHKRKKLVLKQLTFTEYSVMECPTYDGSGPLTQTSNKNRNIVLACEMDTSL